MVKMMNDEEKIKSEEESEAMRIIVDELREKGKIYKRFDEVMPKQEVSRIRELVQGLERAIETTLHVNARILHSMTHSGKALKSIGLRIDLQIDRNTPLKERVRA